MTRRVAAAVLLLLAACGAERNEPVASDQAAIDAAARAAVADTDAALRDAQIAPVPPGTK